MRLPSASGIVERAVATPRGWPVRWRLAAVSATLTLVILLGFALVVGRLTANKLEGDFRDDLRSTAGELAAGAEVVRGPTPGQLAIRGPNLGGVSMTEGAHARVITESGQVVGPTSIIDLGPPDPDSIESVGPYKIATAPIQPELGLPTLYLQYARNHDDLQTTIDRLWLFLGAGVLVGTVLAYLAGLAVAVRAMRPISSLTAAAREIASTRDPSRRMPTLNSDDEVAELGRTLEDMLRSLDQARSETEQAMQRQREFVADASHELRTPLTSILANLELLQASLEAGAEEDHAAVGSALRSSHRMSRLVSDLLLLARADAGRTTARRECDLAEIAAGALSEVRPVAGERRLEINTEGPVMVEGNPDELHRMALNLLDNAVRHTPEGSEVRLEVVRRDGRAVLEVTDDGPGIPSGLEDQVFGRFVRGAGPADQAGGDGTGLGLAIVEAVATSHGGTAEAGSSPSGGARFTVRLPALSAEPRPAALAERG
jgi:two-component system OmpR family sensor kinase